MNLPTGPGDEWASPAGPGFPDAPSAPSIWATPSADSAMPPFPDADPSMWGSPPQPPGPHGSPASSPPHGFHAPTAPSAPSAQPATDAPTSAHAPYATTPPADPLTIHSWQPGIVALRPLPFGDFLTVPFRAMRFNRGAIVGAPLLMFVISALVTAATVWIIVTDPGTHGFFRLEGSEPFAPRVETIIATVVAIVVWIMSDMLSSAVVIPAVAQAALGIKMTLSQALRATTARLGALLALGLLTVVVTATLLTIIFLPAFLGSGSDGSVVAGWTLTVLLLVVMGVPAFVAIMIYLPVARGVVVLEKHGAFTAIRRAISLVPGRFWWTVLILMVVGVINSTVQQGLGIVAQLGSLLVVGLMPNNVTAVALSISLAVLVNMGIIVLAQYSFMGSVYALIYLDMRFRKEGLAFEMARSAQAHLASGSAGAATSPGTGTRF